MKKSIIGTLLFGSLLSVAAHHAHAAPSQERVALQKRSAEGGMRQAKSRALVRTPGRGNAVVAEEVLPLLKERLALDSTGERLAGAGNVDRVRVNGDDWFVDVRDNGNTIRFRREGDPGTSPFDRKPDDAQIESTARAFIEANLARLVVLGDGEELVFLGTKFATGGGHQTGVDAPDPEVIEGWAAAFGRTLDGEFVVGGGSLVVIEYDGAGAVRGIDIDWPEYSAADIELETLDVSAIKARGQAFQGAPGAGESRKEHKFECGFFDPGGRKRNRSEVVQPGCLYSVLSTNKDGTEFGSIFAIPAARQPIAQVKWPELEALCKDPDQCVALGRTPAAK